MAHPKAAAILVIVVAMLAAQAPAPAGVSRERIERRSAGVGERPRKVKDLIPRTRPQKRTVYDRVVARIRPDGTTSLADARRLFSMVIAELPGVDVPVARSRGSVDAGVAIDAILAHYDELSRAERTIVRDALALPDDGHAVAGMTSRAGRTLSAGAQADAALTAILDDVGPLLAARLGPLPVSARVERIPQIRIAEARASARIDTQGCRVMAMPALDSLPRDGQRLVVAHELVHCYAIALHGPQIPVPEWIREGGANYVAALVVFGDQSGPLAGLENVWPLYLSDPGTSVYDRSYDALGIFAFGAAHGVDAARVVLDASRAGVDSSAVLGTLLSGATDDWPGGWWRRTDWGASWDMRGPGITADRAEVSRALLRPGHALRVVLPPAAVGVGRVEFGSELLVVEEASRGNVRLDDGSTRTVASLAGTTWCTNGPCVCPRGTRQAGRTFPRLAGSSMAMGITGGTAAARFLVRGRSLRDVCDRDPLACLVGTWTATGFTTSLFRVRSGGTGLVMAVEPDLAFSLDYGPMSEIVAAVPDVADLVLHVRIDGVATGTWDIAGDQVTAIRLDASALRSSGSAEVAGATAFTISGSVEELIAAAGAQTGVTGPDWLALDCTPTALRLSHPIGEWSFTRDA